MTSAPRQRHDLAMSKSGHSSRPVLSKRSIAARLGVCLLGRLNAGTAAEAAGTEIGISLAATPPMGWNSWNTFGANIDAGVVSLL